MSHGTVSKYESGTATRWRFQFRTDTGAQVRRRGFDSKSDATKAMDAERRRHVGLVDPTSLSVSDYLERWLDEREASGALKQSTALSYRNKLRPAIARFGSIKLSALTPSHLDALYLNLSTEGRQAGGGLSARTVRYTHTVLRKALNDAHRKGLIAQNPADRADPPSTTAARAPEPELWSVEEVRAFLAADWLPTYRRVAWETAFLTGLRRGELCALRWDRVDDGVVHVKSSRTTVGHEVVETTPKSQKSLRRIHIDEGLQRTLQAWRAEQGTLSLRLGTRLDFVFTDALLKEWHPNAMTHAWRADVRRAIKESLIAKSMSLHNCRHWHATQMVGAGVDLNTVADRLGHSTAAFTLSVYGHSDAARDEAAAGLVATRLGQ